MYEMLLSEKQIDLRFDIGRGLFSNVSHVHKFGFNPDVDSNSDPETVWSAGGLYPWSSLATTQTLYCLSTSASDTMDLEIQGLDENYALQTETVTLTGTTAVTTTNTFIRVFRMSAAGNVGTVTARVTSASGTVVAQIDAGKGQTLMAVYTIPAGHYGLLLCGDFAVQKGEDAQVQFFQRPDGEADFRIAHMGEVFQGVYRYDFPIPLKLAAKTDLDVRCAEVESNNTRVTVNFDLILVKE